MIDEFDKRALEKDTIEELIHKYNEKCRQKFNTKDHFEYIDAIREEINKRLDEEYQNSQRISYDHYFELYKEAKKEYGNLDTYKEKRFGTFGHFEGPGDWAGFWEYMSVAEFWSMMIEQGKDI